MSKKGKNGDRDKVRIVKESQYLKCPLTDAELLAYGEEAARAKGDIGVIKDKMAAVKKELQSQIDQKEARLRELSGKIVSKSEFRSVKCERTINFTTGRVTVFRTDDLSFLEDREIYENEKQMELKLGTNEEEKGE